MLQYFGTLQAIWENQYYYLFGFLFLVFIILVISCSQISIVMVYFQLCGEVSHTSRFQVPAITMQALNFNFNPLSGLPLVVALLHHLGWLGCLRLRVFHLLLHDKGLLLSLF